MTLRVLLAMYRDDPNAGGSLRVGETLAKGLRGLGVEAEVCFAYGGPGPVGKSGEAPCHYLGLRGAKDLLGWRRARSLLETQRPQVVHFIDPLLTMHLASTGLPFKRVVHVHGAIMRKKLPLTTYLGWRFLNIQAHRFVFITHGARRSLVERRLVRQNRTVVVYNGIDFSRFQQRPSKEEARRRFGLPQDALVIGMVGRLVRARGFDDLMHILSMLEPRWHGLIAGDGPDKLLVETLAESLGVRHRVRFVGALGDVRPAYSAMDAYAFLALYDSFGLAIAEAMSCRVPVFGLDRAGEYREPQNPLITDDNASFLQGSQRKFVADAENPSLLGALAQRIEGCGQCPDRYAGMVDKAWEHVKLHFTSEVQAQAMLRVYRSLVGANTEPAARPGVSS